MRLLIVIALAAAFVIAFVAIMMRAGCVVLTRHKESYGTVEIVTDECQEGLPHTSGPYTIRMTQADWAGPRRNDILKHEKVHLDQKQHPDRWLSFYRREWGYELLMHPPPNLPAEIIRMLRPNPDTLDGAWAVWRGRYVFFPMYKNSQKQLRGAKAAVWDMLDRRTIDPPEQWKAMFCDAHGCPYQMEHPHEMAAEYITGGSRSPAALKLFDWKH